MHLFQFPFSIPELRARASAAGIELCPSALTFDGSLVEILGLVRQGGGSVRPLGDLDVWHAEYVLFSDDHIERLAAGAPHFPMQLHQDQRVSQAYGVFDVELNGRRVVLAGFLLVDRDPRLRAPVIAVFGESPAVIAEVAGTLGAGIRTPRLQAWGGAIRSVLPPAVLESEIVLPAELRDDLLPWLDRFWRLAGEAARLGIAPRRGLLLVGDPGTGKTQFVRHLLTRYPEVQAHLFIAGKRGEPGDPFGDMLRSVLGRRRPAVVVIEDIDRVAESGAVTREYLLNCLDGLITAEAPTLWVATANDPSLLDRNILDRPGRFDRIAVFPRPAEQERVALIGQFSRLEITAEEVAAAAAASEGLAGAHIREACSAAMLASLDTGNAYGPLLLAEIARVQQGHAAGQRFERALTAPIGFGGNAA